MSRRVRALAAPLLAVLLLSTSLSAQDAAASRSDDRLRLEDVFGLEFARDPQISPDGDRVAYVRTSMDVMKDRRRSRLWIVDADGTDHRPLGRGEANETSPRWSPTGDRLLYVSSNSTTGGSSQMFVRWMESGETTAITQLTKSPRGLAWSPDGKWIAFSMLVPAKKKSLVRLPSAPKGAEWAAPPVEIDSMVYRADGAGRLKHGYYHLFVVPAEGGAARQVTTGDYHHRGGASWSADGKFLYFSANRHPNAEQLPGNSEVYSVSLESGEIAALTSRFGPDGDPAVSPDGRLIAYLGYDDKFQGYHIRRLYVMHRDGSKKRCLSEQLDRSVQQIDWKSDSSGLYCRVTSEGEARVGFISLSGEMVQIVGGVGGTSIGRPYIGGSFSTSKAGRLAYTRCDAKNLSDVAVVAAGGDPVRLTDLNQDLFGHKTLGETEEIWFTSSHDGRKVHGWITKPPHFDPEKKYPLLLEIHGGPFSAYGGQFATEIQLFAAAGYVVLHTNPRGSTSYGEEFSNLIHHNYPGEDYDDLISGVDAVLAKGYVDPEQLFVTGGSGGGTLSAWIVGKTDRFRAAVVAKPVIDWYSFVLTADHPNFFYKYWFPGPPWEHAEHYRKRSPISLAGNVKTPTMLLTGENDLRTPIAQSEQFYQALKLRGVDTMMVRIPGASHGIASRPSQMMAKVAYVLGWCDKYRVPDQ